jgi:hypothetical protein
VDKNEEKEMEIKIQKRKPRKVDMKRRKSVKKERNYKGEERERSRTITSI